MKFPASLLSLIFLVIIPFTKADKHHGNHQHEVKFSATDDLSSDPVPYSTRAYWMRMANQALSELISPCPFQAFGTVIVNHTDTSSDPKGTLVCIGANSMATTGDPTMHGEMAAITNCSKVLTDPTGPYKLSPFEAMKAYSKLSLYTNAESCPMCASAIRWAGFAEYIYGTSISTLVTQGFTQIHISSEDIIRKSIDLPGTPRVVGGILANETDVYFGWQYQKDARCPEGCVRSKGGETCEPLNSLEDESKEQRNMKEL
ncbi:cytidine deaminase-like protein [Xylogone sp. PMI_703]|nr:cytidine deaminase-like protein [Xylogone sp. PMI_703]